MTGDTLVLVGRKGTQNRGTLRSHADRLERRGSVDTACVVTYAEEPVRELLAQFETIEAERLFVLPTCVAHSHDTIDAIPAALSTFDREIHYCEPFGRSPALTELVVERASSRLDPENTTLVLVGLGSGSLPYHREMVEHHAARLRSRSIHEAVVTCYVLQNPAVECVRYNVPTDRAVAVPLFLSRNEITSEEIPEKLELDRGGIEYAAPFRDDRRVTDAIHAEIARQRVLADSENRRKPSPSPLPHPLVTDGEGSC